MGKADCFNLALNKSYMKLYFSIIQLLILIIQSIMIGWLVTAESLGGYLFTRLILLTIFSIAIIINIMLAFANTKDKIW